jgi:hypothetical protein
MSVANTRLGVAHCLIGLRRPLSAESLQLGPDVPQIKLEWTEDAKEYQPPRAAVDRPLFTLGCEQSSDWKGGFFDE